MNLETRNQKATQIFSEANKIRKISKNHYAVESQSSDKSYSVRKLPKIEQCIEFHHLTLMIIVPILSGLFWIPLTLKEVDKQSPRNVSKF
ncbi:MAG: hypothetical protein IS860_10845 [Nitrosopumilus sp.]|nr:hypothetical protein [Nitrosopumilus sp.]